MLELFPVVSVKRLLVVTDTKMLFSCNRCRLTASRSPSDTEKHELSGCEQSNTQDVFGCLSKASSVFKHLNHLDHEGVCSCG